MEETRDRPLNVMIPMTHLTVTTMPVWNGTEIECSEDMTVRARWVAGATSLKRGMPRVIST